MHTPVHYDHVVVVSVDGLRADALPGGPDSLWERMGRRMPPELLGLSRLLERGAWFGNVVSASPDPAVAHGAMLTGQYPLHNGLCDQLGNLRAPSLFTHARRHGRGTVLRTDSPGVLGPTAGFTREVDLSLVGDDERFFDAIAAAESALGFAHFSLGPSVPGTDADGARRACAETVERFAADRLAPFLDRLTRQAEDSARRLLLVITAGHGTSWDPSEDGLPGPLAEGCLRVPLVVIGDGVAPVHHTRRIRTVDITPTVLELSGIPVAVSGLFDGRSLAPVVVGQEKLGNDAPAVAGIYERDRTVEAGYLGDLKVVRRDRAVRVERFDARGEPRLVADDGAEVLAMLDDYGTARAEPGQVAVTDEMRVQLRSQGYSV
ncbi:hypothetical protein [Streptomyces lomondensis]|uniref:Uncharacterized protein n=1 Tax=Streptomyces lomondensis TaxID=68229 RepID=A0ABQ2XF08_9ACTN|nr:hypothetical protein [Streptomyces lomondensis]MCF0077619.1 hypothetical protein [Streptomyces lomondensis]GGX13860.1 hypothetical protein GCM10010383_49890 [Streptomyces lomondensis]